jgi:hypothetical protein
MMHLQTIVSAAFDTTIPVTLSDLAADRAAVEVG